MRIVYDSKVDLVVIGNRSLNGLQEMVLGNVVKKINSVNVAL